MARSSKKAKFRRRANESRSPRSSSRFIKAFKAACLLACFGALGFGMYHAGIWTHGFVHESGYFEIEEPVEITGAGPELESRSRIKIHAFLDERGRNLVEMNGGVLESMLTELPRAKSVDVAKVLPNRLRVEFVERKPVMIVNLDRPYFMDEEGVLLARIELGAAVESGLPLLTGIPVESPKPGMRLNHGRLREILEASRVMATEDAELHAMIVEWNLNSRDELTATLSTRTEVRFGRQAPLHLLDKLSSALKQKKELVKATYIDLRMERQIVYR